MKNAMWGENPQWQYQSVRSIIERCSWVVSSLRNRVLKYRVWFKKASQYGECKVDPSIGYRSGESTSDAAWRAASLTDSRSNLQSHQPEDGPGHLEEPLTCSEKRCLAYNHYTHRVSSDMASVDTSFCILVFILFYFNLYFFYKITKIKINNNNNK